MFCNNMDLSVLERLRMSFYLTNYYFIASLTYGGDQRLLFKVFLGVSKDDLKTFQSNMPLYIDDNEANLTPLTVNEIERQLHLEVKIRNIYAK